MKKLAVLFSCLALSSCFSAGNHDVLGFRNTFLEYFSNSPMNHAEPVSQSPMWLSVITVSPIEAG